MEITEQNPPTPETVVYIAELDVRDRDVMGREEEALHVIVWKSQVAQVLIDGNDGQTQFFVTSQNDGRAFVLRASGSGWRAFTTRVEAEVSGAAKYLTRAGETYTHEILEYGLAR